MRASHKSSAHTSSVEVLCVASLVNAIVPAPEVNTSVERNCNTLSWPPAVPVVAKLTPMLTLPPLALMVVLLSMA